MDVLSEVLKVVKLQGAMYFNAEFTAPWSILSPHSKLLAPYLAPGAGHVINYHLLTEGQASVRLEDGERMPLQTGDVVIFPHGDRHFVENGTPTKTLDNSQDLSKLDRKSTRLNSSHIQKSRMPSSA